MGISKALCLKVTAYLKKNDCIHWRSIMNDSQKSWNKATMIDTNNARHMSDLKDTLSSSISDVSVVTTQGSQGEYVGFTASSFLSVSLNPPLILVSLSKSLSTYEVFANSDNFAVNILAHDQQHLATTFSTKSLDRFEGLKTSLSNGGNPLFPCVSAWIDCKVFERIDAGDHTLYLGSVETFANYARAGLGYTNRQYFNSGLVKQQDQTVSSELCSLTEYPCEFLKSDCA